MHPDWEPEEELNGLGTSTIFDDRQMPKRRHFDRREYNTKVVSFPNFAPGTPGAYELIGPLRVN